MSLPPVRTYRPMQKSRQPISEQKLDDLFASMRERGPTPDQLELYRRSLAAWRANPSARPAKSRQRAALRTIATAVGGGAILALSAFGLWSWQSSSQATTQLAAPGPTTPAPTSAPTEQPRRRLSSSHTSQRKHRPKQEAVPVKTTTSAVVHASNGTPATPAPKADSPPPPATTALAIQPGASPSPRPADVLAMIEKAELLSRGGQAAQARRVLQKAPRSKLSQRNQQRLAALEMAIGCQLGESAEPRLSAFMKRWQKETQSPLLARICQACDCRGND